jgi:DNA-binding protein H-NS
VKLPGAGRDNILLVPQETTMTNLIDIQSQIEKLQKQASDIRVREFDKTVQDIVAKMQAFGISLKDIQAETTRNSKARTKPKTSPKAAKSKAAKPAGGGTVAAKYRGPNGETWSGRGLTPKWLAVLVANGKTKEEFAIQP